MIFFFENALSFTFGLIIYEILRYYYSKIYNKYRIYRLKKALKDPKHKLNFIINVDEEGEKQ